MARRRLTAEQEVDKQIKRSEETVQDYRDGVAAVAESPTQALLRKKDKMRSEFNKSMADGRFEDGCNSVTREDWVRRTQKKGGDNWVEGMRTNRTKMVSSRRDLIEYRRSLEERVRAMPNDTEAQRDARHDEMVRGMREYKTRRSTPPIG